MKKIIKTLSVVFGLCLLVMSVNIAFAGEGIMLKDVNSTNYYKYIKPVKAAYGYNKGECNRKYLPHEEHFYSEYYDHWNVDVVYDSKLIKKLYTDFEKTKPVIKSLKKSGGYMNLKWNKINGAQKCKIWVKRGNGGWKTLKTVAGSTTAYIDKTKVKKGTKVSYRICGIKHVRLWDVKTRDSVSAEIIR